MVLSGKKILLFPVETAVRELDYRLILAVLCARPGWQIIIGDHEHLFPLTLKLRNAVLVLKNLIGGKRPWKYPRYKELNVRCIQLDEEGGIFEGDKSIWKMELRARLDVAKVDPADYICTWGPFQADFYRSLNPACADHIIPTGHPRLDLCRPRFRELYREEADDLIRKHGRFIVINTNILSNNAMGPDVMLKWYNVDPADKEKRTRYIEQYCHELQRGAHFIRLVNHLSDALPDVNIIVRPHPSEDIRTYQALFNYVPRVTVTREGSLQAWLTACGALVHGGCTTALEGYLCGTPIINFRPIRDERFEVALPNLVGAACGTPGEVVAALRGLANGRAVESVTPGDLTALTEMMSNFGPGADAFDSLAHIIRTCQDEAPPTQSTGLSATIIWRRLTDPFTRFTRSAPRLRRLLHSKDRGIEKFPPLDQALIRKKLEIIGNITGIRVQVAFNTAKIFSITID